MVANEVFARVADVAPCNLLNFIPAAGGDCSLSTTSVNRRVPPSMPRAELGIHGLKSWGRDWSRKKEGLSFRSQDLHFGRGAVSTRDGKGQKDRVTLLRGVLQQPLREQLRQVREQHDPDLQVHLGRALRSDALARKFPHGDREWAWQWVSLASSHDLDRRTGVHRWYHLHETRNVGTGKQLTEIGE
ncbi:MAG TPA: hypothetical protein VKF17_19475 [Isosphaeraceae bacterium]|nr:hypothetical protein [Isosphaeraceae bacterium]